MQVNYEVYVPRETSVVCKAEFADTDISGITGTVSVDSLLGAVTLRNIEGAVTMRARGEYPIIASGLAQGGVFTMRGSLAQFSDVGGDLHVSNSDGSIELGNCGRRLPGTSSATTAPSTSTCPRDTRWTSRRWSCSAARCRPRSFSPNFPSIITSAAS
jgi:hypothetical protein